MVYTPASPGTGKPTPKPRLLTEVLRQVGEEDVQFEGRIMPAFRVAAILLWRIITDGFAETAGGRKLTANTRTWFDVVKFVYGQIDGPPPANLNLSSDKPLEIRIAGVDPEDI